MRRRSIIHQLFQIREILRDRRASALIEFAIVSAPMIALSIASLETALAFFTEQGLQTAAETAARTITTGQVQAAGLSQAQFKSQVCATLMPYLKCSSLYIDIQNATSFGAVNTSNMTITYDANGNVTNNFAYSIGGSGSIVIVRLMYLWPISMGPLGVFSATGGTQVLNAVTVAKTEPYS